MFCTKCGSQQPDNGQFCTQCGAPLQEVVSVEAHVSIPASTAPGTLNQQPAPKKSGALIAVVAILFIVLIAVIVLFVVNPFDSDKNDDSAGNPSSGTTSSSSESNATVVTRIPSGSIRIDMPKKYADLGYKWEYINDELRFQNKDGITSAVIYQGNYTLTFEEAVGNTYGLGTTIISGKTTPVNIEVFFWQKSSNGMGLIHAADPIGDGKPSLDFIGITPEEIASWVFLEQNDNYHEAAISERIVITEPSPTTSSSNNAPFYGVWIGAFSEEWRAESYCKEAREKGFNPQIFVSSEWTNLNPKTYWVVAAVVSPSQQIAERQLISVQSAGYSDAYVKYSGNYKG